MQTLFLCSIFLQVEAEIWKTAQNSINTWFNWRSQFHTTVLLSLAVYTMSLKWAVVPRLSIQQYPGNHALHLTISPSVSIFPRGTVPMLPVQQLTFIYNPSWAQDFPKEWIWWEKIRSIGNMSTNHTLASKQIQLLLNNLLVFKSTQQRCFIMWKDTSKFERNPLSTCR